MTATGQQRAVRGIHHITALSSSPQQTVEFYTSLLGLRLVKLTVNFDEPSVYHLYFGDRTGAPGTILTFFPFPLASRGKPGPGQVTSIAFQVPVDSLGFWANRLSRHGVEFEGPVQRFGVDVIRFRDSDGLPLELVASGTETSDWHTPDISEQNAISRFDGVSLTLRNHETTAQLLQRQLGMVAAGEHGNRFRFEVGDAAGSSLQNIDLISLPDEAAAIPGAGTVHHIAWRCEAEMQERWRESIVAAGHNVTPIRERKYFRSIYFREPGGVLFEIATDGPGFDVDESVEALGSSLQLPEWLESRRAQIEKALPPISYRAQAATQ